MGLQTRDVIIYITIGVIIFFVGYLVGAYQTLNFCVDAGRATLNYFNITITDDNREIIQKFITHRARLGL